MITIQFTLIGIAFALTLISGITGRVPIWVPLLLVCIAMLVPR